MVRADTEDERIVLEASTPSSRCVRLISAQVSSTIVYGNAMFPLDGANTKWRRTLAPCDMQPFETVMEQITSNEGTVLLVLEREI